MTKPIRFGDIEKTFSGLAGGRSAIPAALSGQTFWGKTEALDRLGGDEELLRELCQVFLEESPRLLQKLRQAIVDADAGAVMRAAHSLKGELSYLGAAGASQTARELEDMGHENNLSRAAEALVVVEREVANLHLGLKDSGGAIS